MEEGSPDLGVDFVINFGDAFGGLKTLDDLIGTTSANAVRDFQRIQSAVTGGMDLKGAADEFRALGATATREMRALAQETRRVEQSGEALVRQLERQNATFGKSRDEIRAMRVEEAALAAERTKNADLAMRLRAELTLSSNAQKQAAQAAAQAQVAAAAAVNAQLLERSRLEAALERNFGVGRPSATQSGATFSALAERERGLELAEREAAAEREVAAVQRQQNSLLAERANIEVTLQRMTGVGRSRATDNGATFSALAARAAEDEARATAAAAASAQQLAREHANLVTLVRGSQAAMEADAAAAERLRMSTDPLYAAVKRLNDEIAESTRLYRSGATAPAEYARQQEVLTGRLRDVQREHDVVNRSIGTVGTTGKLAGHHMQNLAFQFQDLGVQMFAAAGSSAPIKMALMAMLQQGAQIQGIMSQAGIGVRGVGAAFGQMSKAILLATVTNPILLGIAATIGIFAGTVALLNKSANEGADMKKYAASLGLTAKEIRNLDNVTVTWGDTTKAVFQVTGAAIAGVFQSAGTSIWSYISEPVTAVWKLMTEWMEWIGTGVRDAANFMIGGFVGAYKMITKHWEAFPAVLGDVFYSAVNASIGAINALVKAAVDAINLMGAQANKILPDALKIPTLEATQIATAKNQYAGAAADIGKAAKGALEKEMGTDFVGKGAAALRGAGRAVVGAINAQQIKNAQARIKAQALEKGYLDPEAAKKPKVDKHAEQLARENAAIEAQIRNLYALAAAYRVSGAAALIAEARVKAESDAIKKRGDIEMFVDRQVRLSIAQRVSDAAKTAATMRDQARLQADINGEVAAGVVTAQRAAELVQERIAELPLLAALEAAQQRGLTEEVRKATEALDAQRAAQGDVNAAAMAKRFNEADAAANDRLAELREELRLVGETDKARIRALTTLRATREAEQTNLTGKFATDYIAKQVQIAVQTDQLANAQRNYNDALSFTADQWDLIANNVQNAASGMADALGEVGRAIGDMASIYTGYQADRARLDLEHRKAFAETGGDQAAIARENAKFALRSSTAQIGAYGDMVSAAKGFFKEGSSGYKALAAAEKVYRVAQLAMSLQAMVQSVIETTTHVAGSAARATADGAAGIAAQSKLPFPANIAAMAATGAALVAAGIAVFGGGGGKSAPPVTNTGTGTVLGDRDAQSESIRRAIDALTEVDTLTNSYARQMAGSLRSIESQIGGLASVLVRGGDINASAGVTEGFKANAVGSVLGSIPLIGGMLKGLFGSTTKVIGSGLYGGPQSVGSILGSGFDASSYSDVEKKKKLFGITTSTKSSTQYGAADPTLENQFTLILRSFSDAIGAAAGPLGESTQAIQSRLSGFVVDIGKIDLKGLTGTEIEEKLAAIFGAAADGMADAAFPGIARFQKVGEGAFETLVRVASTVEAVTNALGQLGGAARALGVDAKLGLADQFGSVGDMTSAIEAYFETFYSKEEQNAARTAQLGRVFGDLGLSMPATLAGFRQLVDAQDLTTAAGQSTYATLLQLVPAFADLASAMDGAKSAADVLSERQDLERKMLELRGDTAALRALDLAKLDASNRELQQQLWAMQDAQEAARAADELRKAWTSVGDSIMDEVRRIRGLTGAETGGGFASLMGRFNAATSAARSGDQDAAKLLPGLSQSLLTAATLVATSRQELDRVQAQTAASLEATYGVIGALTGANASTAADTLAAAATAAQATSTPAAANDDMAGEVRALREENAGMRRDLTAALATIASNTGRIDRRLEDVTAASGGDAISISSEAA